MHFLYKISSSFHLQLDEQSKRLKTSEPIKVNLKYEYKQRPVTVETPVHERIRQVLTPGKRKLDSSGTSGSNCQSNMQESPECKSNIPPSPKRKRKSSPKNLGRNIFAMVTAPLIKLTDKVTILIIYYPSSFSSHPITFNTHCFLRPLPFFSLAERRTIIRRTRIT
jgi:hypothetical protein